jgi:hypothetical protein
MYVVKGAKGAGKTDGPWMSQAELQKAAEDAGGFSPEMIVNVRIAAFKAPAVQAREIAEKMTNIKKIDGGFSADLTPEMAKQMLTFPRPAGSTFPEMAVSNAKGDVKFWVKDGELIKMAVHLTGTRSFNDQENPVDQVSTTEITDVGRTKVEVPAEAAKKIG